MQYAPNHHSYMRFAQSEDFEASLRRRMLDLLLHDCFNIQDHAGVLTVRNPN
jgi:hypothetical protein